MQLTKREKFEDRILCREPWDADRGARVLDRMLQKRMSLGEVCKDKDMPSAYVVGQWLKVDEGFASAYRGVLASFADELAWETLRDAEANVAVEVKNPTAAMKLLVETKRWLAEKLDRDTWGKETKVVGDVNRPIGLVAVATGVRRDLSAKEIEEIERETLESARRDADRAARARDVTPGDGDEG